MVVAINFFASREDEDALLNYLDEPDTASLHPWPTCDLTLTALDRAAARTRTQVMIVSHELGSPRLIRADDPAMDGGTRAALFNRMNWERLEPAEGEGLVDSNSSPVLLWQRGDLASTVLHQSAIGSQADTIGALSRGYERWVARLQNWVRRCGTRVWGLEGHDLRPDLDLDIDHISSIYALPDALAALESGMPGRR